MMDRMIAARTGLLLDEPFWGSLALGLKLEEDNSQPTAWVDGRTMGFNSSFIGSLTHDQTKALIAHEVMHCANGHPWRRDGRQMRKFNVACLAEGTPILMADGSQKAIEDVGIGESVMSPEGPSRVLGVKYSGVQFCTVMQYAELNLWCTDNHPVLTTSGVKNAETCEGYRGLYWPVKKQPEGNAVRFGKLQNDVTDRVGNQDAGQLLQHKHVFEEAEFTGRSVHDQAVQHPRSARAIGDGSGIFGGNRRWGRNHKREGVGREIYPTTSAHLKHVAASLAVDEGPGVLRNAGEKRDRSQVFSYVLERLPGGPFIALNPALYGHQGSACGFDLRAYYDSQESTKRRSVDGTYASDCLRNSGVESARITVARSHGEVKRVYDLVTEKQFVIAAGLVVHNCDKAINSILKEAGFTLPKGAYYAEGPEVGQSAEWIYARLPDEPEGQGGQGDPTGQGEVRDAPTSAGKGDDDGEVPTEAEWQQATKQAALAAKAQGKLPANLERLVKDIGQARVDWRSALRRFVQERSKADYAWNRPSSRYLSLGMYLPALESHELGELAIAVDTSGSIDDVALKSAQAEVMAVIDECQPAAVTVYYADAAVARADRFERGDPVEWRPKGGGGTDFRPVFKACEDAEIPPVCLIYITDLMGTHVESTGIPTIWVTDGPSIGPFGETVRMS